MRRVVLTGAILLGLAGSASAGVIASFTADFTPGAFPTGWQYMRNTGPIGTSPGYVPLVWDAGNSIYSVNGTGLPDPGPPVDWTSMAADWVHPGTGLDEDSYEHYLVLAYTIQSGEAGAIDLVDGSLYGYDPAGAGGNSNGWEIVILVNSAAVGSPLVFPWSMSPSAFQRSLGDLAVGDTVYVALGPNGSQLYDSAKLDFTLTSTPSNPVPEPASSTLLGLGLVALVRRVRHRRAWTPFAPESRARRGCFSGHGCSLGGVRSSR